MKINQYSNDYSYMSQINSKENSSVETAETKQKVQDAEVIVKKPENQFPLGNLIDVKG